MSVNAASKQSSFSLAIMTKALVVLFSLNLIVERIAQLSQAINMSGSSDWQALLRISVSLPHFWTGLLVPVCYLVCLWAAANLLKAFETSPRFDDATLQALRNLGAQLMYVGIAALFIVPTLESWINLGGRSFKVNFQIEHVAVGMIGMIVKLIARRLLEQSAQENQPAAST